jgi:ribonuclease R
VAFVAERGGRTSAKEIARAFAVKGEERVDLRRLLQRLRRSGMIARSSRRTTRREWPDVAVVEVTGTDEEGELLGETPALPGAVVRILVEFLKHPAPGEGDRLLCRLEPGPEGELLATPLRLLPKTPKQVVGVVERAPFGFVLRPAGRRDEREYRLVPSSEIEVAPGDMVRARLVHGRPLALPEARVVERFGAADDPRTITPAVAAQFELPVDFPAPALDRAGTLRPATRRGREDLRDLPLVTIDGEDARDFDDAVWAERDDAASNPGGFRLVVAIADVAWYVRPDDPIDAEALRRGNSVYFPDRALHMLPERLANDLCSLKPDVDRPCLAADLRIDRHGRIREARIRRALMRSRARLTYTQVQAARDGAPDAVAERLWDTTLAPLFEVYAVLRRAREKRGAIDIELPERRVIFDDAGAPVAIRPRPQLESNKLIEECMIAANVAVATALSQAKAPILYRVHDKPDPTKLDALADYLERLGIPWSRTAGRPGDFTRLLRSVADPALYESLAGFVLRCQAQAVYSPHNIGHFGLNLRCYTHFTSPIRRYSDLVVHRALIRVFELGPGGERRPADVAVLEKLGQHLSQRERTAMEAEREALQRFIAMVMRQQIGARFRGRVTGVQSFGLFVTLEDSGAEGFIPASSLGEDVFHFDPRHHALVGRRYGESFGLGDLVEVTLMEADAIRGTLLFRLEGHERAHGARLARDAWQKGRGRGMGGRQRSVRR